MEEIKQKKSINIQVGLNEEKMPVSISWEADDQKEGAQESKAMFISFFDRDHKDTSRIDLWTKDMQVVEMDRFVFQTLRGLADTYFRATQNKELANQMQQFVQYFGEKTEVIPK